MNILVFTKYIFFSKKRLTICEKYDTIYIIRISEGQKMADMNIVSERIKLIRRAKKLKQSDLAKISGISQPQISTIENGDCDVRLSTLIALADALQVTLNDLFYEYTPNFEQYIMETCEDEYEGAADQMHEFKIYKNFYPKGNDDLKISTLMEFIVYLPLVEPSYLFKVLSNIYGDFNSREEYIARQLDWLVSTIPNSPERRYADYVYNIIQQRKKHKTPEIAVEFSELKEEREAYRKLVENKQELFQMLTRITKLSDECKLQNAQKTSQQETP